MIKRVSEAVWPDGGVLDRLIAFTGRQPAIAQPSTN
jgi:hypothetical protein